MNDILFDALKSLKPGEEIICTLKTFHYIKGRIDSFASYNRGYKFITSKDAGVRCIKRTR